MAALDKRSPSHGDHVRGVTELVESLARKLGLTQEELDHVRLAAELHDIGKVALRRRSSRSGSRSTRRSGTTCGAIRSWASAC